MKPSPLYPLTLAILLAHGVAAQAETPATPGTASQGEARAVMRERMQSHRSSRLDELKNRLKLDAGQESAWTTFAQTMQAKPLAAMPSRAEMEKMTTPERLDRMRALRQQQHAEMDRRAEAAKALYGTLSDDQKKLFDRHSGPMMMHQERGAPGAKRAP